MTTVSPIIHIVPYGFIVPGAPAAVESLNARGLLVPPCVSRVVPLLAYTSGQPVDCVVAAYMVDNRKGQIGGYGGVVIVFIVGGE